MVSLQGPGGLTDYISQEYVPEFLGGECEVIEKMRFLILHEIIRYGIALLVSNVSLVVFVMLVCISTLGSVWILFSVCLFYRKYH